MRRIIQRYQDGGAVEFGPYMPDQLPSDFQPGSQQQDTGSIARSDGYNIMDMQGFVDNNSVMDGINPNLYPSVGPLGVNPMVSTGIPKGGYAKQAIADYLAGETLGGPLSYVAGESNVPDYGALADELGTSVTDRYRPAAAAAAAVGDNNTAHKEMMNVSSPGSGTEAVNNAYENLVDNNDPNLVSSFGAGGGPEDHSAYMLDAYGNYYDNVLNNDNYSPEEVAALNPSYNAGLAEANQPGMFDSPDNSSGRSTLSEAGIRNVGGSFAQDGDNYGLPMDYMVVNSSDGSSQVFGPDNTVFDSIVDASVHSAANDSGSSGSDFFSPGAMFAGGGTDNQGNFGIIGDIGGNLAEALGIVPEGYDWGANELDGLAGLGQAGVTQSDTEAKKGGILSGLNLTGPVDPNLTLHRGGRYDTSPGHSTDNDSIAKDEASRGAFGNQIWSPALGRHLNPSQVANRRANGLPVNNGGFIGPLVKGYNNGGVSLAKSGLREEEIQERQRMQARLPQVQQSALPGIGSKLALGAIDKGIGSAASALAGQQGLAGTLGTALGGTAGAAGTGMMAALGPIGIGLGLGKLFGVFNKGGKVTCSCGKPNCNCSSKMKYSPLGGSYD